MRILVLHGPNLNLFGVRNRGVYGSASLADIDKMLGEEAGARGHEIDFFQSNHEGALIDRIHAAEGVVDGALMNAGALSHYSYALRDAVEAVTYPVVEVHVSNVYAREEFRHRSVVSAVCRGIVAGFGPHSYLAALEGLVRVIGS